MVRIRLGRGTKEQERKTKRRGGSGKLTWADARFRTPSVRRVYYLEDGRRIRDIVRGISGSKLRTATSRCPPGVFGAALPYGNEYPFEVAHPTDLHEWGLLCLRRVNPKQSRWTQVDRYFAWQRYRTWLRGYYAVRSEKAHMRRHWLPKRRRLFYEAFGWQCVTVLRAIEPMPSKRYHMQMAGMTWAYQKWAILAFVEKYPERGIDDLLKDETCIVDFVCFFFALKRLTKGGYVRQEKKWHPVLTRRGRILLAWLS